MPPTYRLRVGVFAAAAATALALSSRSSSSSSSSSAALPLLTVLPLGDSITFGCGSDAAPPDWFACCPSTSGGYRAPLWAALNGSGINASVLMVGTESDGPDWVPVEQRAHEGHPGWTISGIHGLRSIWQKLAPSVVLLKAGTNDVGQGHSNASMASDMEALLKDLRADLPAGRVFMTSILNLPDSQNPGFRYTINYYNEVTLPPLAAKYGVDFVDINGATGMCYGPNNTLTNLCAVCNGPCGGYNPKACPPSGYS
jgi:lysophospholipase L1-like esterase